MPKTIERDHKSFHDVIAGKKRHELRKHIKNSSIFPMRGKEGKLRLNLPIIEQPFFTYGDNDSGIGRGKGEKGKVIGRDDPNGKDDGAGQEEGEGMIVEVDMEEVFAQMQEEMELPDLKPKIYQTFEDVDIKYNSISKVGPESLRHNRRTMKEAYKRVIASGKADDFHYVPGQKDPIRNITPINTDRRYRQWKEINEPSTNAVVMFGRDGSASMDQEKCDIISDMSWWLEAWIRRFYKNVETCYFWHDVVAQEVDSNRFYKYRYGGGTTCSSCLNLISKQFENRFNPQKYNIYCFYFSDGDNWSDDNSIFVKSLEEDFSPQNVNLFAITQIMCPNNNTSLKKYVDNYFSNRQQSNLSTFSIGGGYSSDWHLGRSSKFMTSEERNSAIKDAIKAHLSKEKKKEY